MKKEAIFIGGAILLLGVAAIGAFVYVNQSNLEYQREKQAEAAKLEDAKRQQEADAATQSRTQYYICAGQAQTEKDNQYKANSQYETTDASGGTIYHGNATTFDRIEQTYQTALNRCASLYGS